MVLELDFSEVDVKIRMQGVEFSFGDGDQLDGEVEGGTAGDACLGDSVVTVGQVGWDGQGSGLALAHSGHALFVALDNLKNG